MTNQTTRETVNWTSVWSERLGGADACWAEARRLASKTNIGDVYGWSFREDGTFRVAAQVHDIETPRTSVRWFPGNEWKG